MKLILKILLLFFLAQPFSFARETKIIHITDINLDKNNASAVYNTIKEINQYKDIDFVVFGGNNIAKPNFENFNTFLYLIKKVNKKVVVLMGSSDVLSTSGIDKKYYLKRVNRALFFTHSTKPNRVFQKNGLVFVTMDGVKQYFQSSNGYYTKEELAWLNRVLNKYKNKPVVILQHFPILEANSQWLQTARVEEYWKVLSKYNNVKIIISGHYGNNLETKCAGVYHIITENYTKNRAYNIITIDLKDDFVAAELVK